MPAGPIKYWQAHTTAGCLGAGHPSQEKSDITQPRLVNTQNVFPVLSKRALGVYEASPAEPSGNARMPGQLYALPSCLLIRRCGECGRSQTNKTEL